MLFLLVIFNADVRYFFYQSCCSESTKIVVSGFYGKYTHPHKTTVELKESCPDFLKLKEVRKSSHHSRKNLIADSMTGKTCALCPGIKIIKEPLTPFFFIFKLPVNVYTARFFIFFPSSIQDDKDTQTFYGFQRGKDNFLYFFGAKRWQGVVLFNFRVVEYFFDD